MAAAQGQLAKALNDNKVQVAAISANASPTSARAKLLAQIAALKKVRCCDEVVLAISAHGNRVVTRTFNGGTLKKLGCLNEKLLVPTEDQTSSSSGWDPDQDMEHCLPGEPSTYRIELPDGPLFASELADALAAIPSCHISVLIESCYGGGFLSALQGVKGVERVLASASPTEVSKYAEDQPAPVISGAAGAAPGLGSLGPSDSLGQYVEKAWQAGLAAANPKLVQNPAKPYDEDVDHPVSYDRPAGAPCVCCDPSTSPGVDCTSDPILPRQQLAIRPPAGIKDRALLLLRRVLNGARE
jgi:hypothetical protein